MIAVAASSPSGVEIVPAPELEALGSLCGLPHAIQDLCRQGGLRGPLLRNSVSGGVAVETMPTFNYMRLPCGRPLYYETTADIVEIAYGIIHCTDSMHDDGRSGPRGKR